jgi:hypothetical protein
MKVYKLVELFLWNKGAVSTWALVAHACNPGYSEDRDERIVVQSQPREIVRPYLKKNPIHTWLVEWVKW